MSRKNPDLVLLVEDDEALRSLLRDELEAEGWEVCSAASAEEALQILDESPVALVVSDLRLPGATGTELLRTVRQRPDPPSFILITAFGTIDQAVQSLKDGADDFLTKPLDLDHFSLRVARVLENRRLRSEVHRYREILEGDDFHGMVGRSPPMQAFFRNLRRVARGHGPVLFLGESGVGKELAARAVHAESSRARGPFLAVNCAGVPESLLESEFFGHVRGAFSGATSTRGGLFQEAEGGSLLLDEIGEMPPSLQAKLLRVLQEGAVRPVGSDRTVGLDVRVMASTNQDLASAIAEGRFRRDLFHRLETFPLTLPPLRDRGSDLELLAARFIRRHAARLGRPAPVPSPAFMDALRRYPFPGNVRELENVVERAVTFCEGDVLDAPHLPERIRAGMDEPKRRSVTDEDLGLARGGPASGGEAGGGPASGSGAILEAEEAAPGATADALLPAFLLEGDTLPTLRELQARYLEYVLEKVDGNKRRAAALLGIGRGTLYRKLVALESKDPPSPDAYDEPTDLPGT
jgi:two-component system, NtrC family, response regulator AtoC